MARDPHTPSSPDSTRDGGQEQAGGQQKPGDAAGAESSAKSSADTSGHGNAPDANPGADPDLLPGGAST